MERHQTSRSHCVNLTVQDENARKRKRSCTCQPLFLFHPRLLLRFFSSQSVNQSVTVTRDRSWLAVAISAVIAAGGKAKVPGGGRKLPTPHRAAVLISSRSCSLARSTPESLWVRPHFTVRSIPINCLQAGPSRTSLACYELSNSSKKGKIKIEIKLKTWRPSLFGLFLRNEVMDISERLLSLVFQIGIIYRLI